MEVNLRDYLKESNVLKLIARITFLYQDETPYKDITTRITGGSLSVTNDNGARRSFSMNVENTGFDFLFKPQNIDIQQKIKLELGYDVYGTEYYLPQGVFILKNLSYSGYDVSFGGVDKFSWLNGELAGRVSETYKFDVGTPIKQVMRDILTLAGDPKIPILNIGSDVTPYTLYIQSNGTYSDMLLSLNGMLSHNMYYDVDGILRCEPEIADIYKEVVWDYYADDKDFHYQGASYDYPLNEVYNAIKVTGNNVNGNLATGYAENRNPQSRYNIYRTHNIPRLAPQIDDPVIPDDTYAQGRAEYELKKIMAHFSSVSLQSTPLFLLKENKIITLTESKHELENERFLINNLTIPLDGKGGLTSINAVKASDLSFI